MLAATVPQWGQTAKAIGYHHLHLKFAMLLVLPVAAFRLFLMRGLGKTELGRDVEVDGAPVSPAASLHQAGVLGQGQRRAPAQGCRGAGAPRRKERATPLGPKGKRRANNADGMCSWFSGLVDENGYFTDLKSNSLKYMPVPLTLSEQ